MKNIRGGGGIGVAVQHNGISITMQRPKKETIVSSAVDVAFYQVIAAPTYADPTKEETDPLYAGLSYYTLRLLTSSVTAWEDGEVIDLGSTPLVYRAYPDEDGELFKALQSMTCGAGNVPTPHDDNDYWELMDEVRVDHVLGFDEAGAVDMREFIPWLPVGTVTKVVSRQVDEATRYYIDDGFTYIGGSDDKSITWFEQDGRAGACAK